MRTPFAVLPSPLVVPPGVGYVPPSSLTTYIKLMWHFALLLLLFGNVMFVRAQNTIQCSLPPIGAFGELSYQ